MHGTAQAKAAPRRLPSLARGLAVQRSARDRDHQRAGDGQLRHRRLDLGRDQFHLRRPASSTLQGSLAVRASAITLAALLLATGTAQAMPRADDVHAPLMK